MSELGELGLSSYEERAYRALLALGAATASDVADHGEVPSGRVYGVLNGLEARGLVAVHAGDPRRYEPVAPETAADRLLAARTDELDRERERYEELADAVRSRLAPTPPVGGNVWTADLGDDDAVALLRERARSVRDRYLVAVGAPFGAANWEAYRTEVEALVEELRDGVTCRVLCSDRVTETIPVEQLTAVLESDVEVRRLPALHVTFDVADGDAAYLDVPHPFRAGERFGFVDVSDPDVAGQLEAAFDAAWSSAEPL